MKDLKVRPKSVKFLEENKGKVSWPDIWQWFHGYDNEKHKQQKQTLKKKSCWQRCGEIGSLAHSGGNARWNNWYGEKYKGSSKIKNRTIMWSFIISIPPMSIYPKKWKSKFQRDIITLMFITAVITVADGKRCWTNLNVYQQVNG